MEKEIKLYIKSNLTQFEKVIKLATETHNDMDLGKAIRTLVIEHNEASKKPPFTDDYIQ